MDQIPNHAFFEYVKERKLRHVNDRQDFVKVLSTDLKLFNIFEIGR